MAEKGIETAVEYQKQEIAKAQESLLDLHLGNIKQTYVTFSAIKKQAFLGGLESFLDGWEKETAPNWFDGNKAKKVREKMGLNQKEAAKEMGLSNTTLCQYETGERRPSKKYIDWLRKHGYEQI